MDNGRKLGLRCWLLLVWLVCASRAEAQTTSSSSARSSLPSYVQFVDSALDPSSELLSDSFFYENSRGVVFPVNKWDLNPNDPFLRELVDSVLPEARRRNW